MLKIRTFAIIASLSILSCISTNAGNDNAPWPFPDIPVTASLNIKDGWKYAWDSQDKGMNENWFAPTFNKESWKPVSVPGVWDMPPGKIPISLSRGVGWYSCKLKLPDNFNGEPAIVFLSAMYMTDVWLDGEYLGNHRGGYTPFMFSLDDKLKPGTEKELVVRVDSRLTNKTIPGQNLGWNAYGGLTGEVFLISRPRYRIEELRTRTKIDDDGTAHLEITGNILNNSKEAREDELNIKLMADSKACASSTLKYSLKPGVSAPFKVDFIVPQARLWSPDDPYLHTLEMAWRGDKSPQIRLPIGLREIRIDGPNFLVNGKRLWLQGFGRHLDLKDYGPCIPHDFEEQELQRMKNFGANHLRTGHYPNLPYTYAACDRIGLITFVEIPAWQQDWTWMNSDQAWNDWAEPQISEMIQWYRNFTSIISWGAANEMGGTVEYNKRSVAYIKGKDPSRIPMIVVAATENPDLYKLLPMAGRNLHYGWYHSKRVYDGLRRGLAENLRLSEESNTPIWIAEIGAQGNPGAFTGGYNDDHRGSETYLDKVVRFGFQYCAVTSERVIGIAVWTWSDFCRDYELTPHGIFGLGREKKIVAYSVRNLLAGDLRLFLCEDDSTCRPGGGFHAKAYVFNPRLQQVPQGLTVNWRIMHGSEVLLAGKLPVTSGSARAIPVGEISWQIPATSKGMFSLWAELSDDKGTRIHTNSVHFGAGEPVEKPGVLFLSVLSNGKPVDATAEFTEMKIPVYSDPGLIIPLPEGEYDFVIRRGDESKSIKVRISSGKATEEKVEFK